jgi:dienelactone hydrolase
MMKQIMGVFLMCCLVLAGSPSGKNISYKIDGDKYEGYYVSPSPEAPLIIIVHDWDGLTDYEVKRAGMLADLGYAVFVADLYGAGIRPTEFKDKHARATELYQDREKMRTRLWGALKAAKKEKANVDNAVAIGYCFGGAAILEFARAGADLKGFVAFHGGLDTPEGEDYSQTKGEILVLHGSADASVSMEDFAKLNIELETHKVSHEMIAYSGAPHAFTVFGSDRYRADADQKSWNRFTRFLTEVLD